MRQEQLAHLSAEFLAKRASLDGTIYDKSFPGREGCAIPDPLVPRYPLPSDEYLRSEPPLLPEVSQSDVVRHYTLLSGKNYSLGRGTYPLGSCTMKYNPKAHEEYVRLPGFSEVHPAQPNEVMQGTLQAIFELQEYMAKITGMDASALSPMGGAHGELAGVLMIKAFHTRNGEGNIRKRIFIPDSAHGTNPASAAMAGFKPVEVKSDHNGNMSLDDIREKMGDGTDVAGIMATQPNTFGLWDNNLRMVARWMHEVGALVYGDGANLNAILGKIQLRKVGIDVMHTNTHKPLTTPHGGGGPGAGPVMCTAELAPFLPNPIVGKDEKSGLYTFFTPEHSIGRVSGWSGNVAVLLRAYSYIRTMGEEGLREAANNSVLNANYLGELLNNTFPREFGADRSVMHEFVAQGIIKGMKIPHLMNDIAKRLIDYGFHPPTIYFPLPAVMPEAMMIEPPETESKEAVELLANAMLAIAKEAIESPDLLREAPHFTPVRRLDETTAARKPPILKWTPDMKGTESTS